MYTLYLSYKRNVRYISNWYFTWAIFTLFQLIIDDNSFHFISIDSLFSKVKNAVVVLEKVHGYKITDVFYYAYNEKRLWWESRTV